MLQELNNNLKIYNYYVYVLRYDTTISHEDVQHSALIMGLACFESTRMGRACREYDSEMLRARSKHDVLKAR